MSIRINKDICVGCGKCNIVCPGSLIEIKDKKANMAYPKDCWGCASCVKECALGAIEFYLGADIGGNGSSLSIRDDGDILHWNIKKQNGEIRTIDINRKESNKY